MSNALLAMIAARKAQVSRVKTIKPKAGRNRYRILPGWRPAAHAEAAQFWHDFGQHYIKDVTDPERKKIKAVALCSDKTYGRACSTCAALTNVAKMAHDDVTAWMVKEAAANGRVLLNVLELDGTTPGIPQILEVAPTVFNGNKGVGGIISLFEEWPTLLDPTTGHDIIIEKSGTGMETRYAVQIAGSSKPVPPEALTKLHDLDKFVADEAAGSERALLALGASAGITPALAAPAAGAALPGFADVPDFNETLVTPPAATVAVAVAAQPPAAPPAPAPAPAEPAVATAAPAPAPAAAAAAPPAAPAPSTGDAELDALLKDLG